MDGLQAYGYQGDADSGRISVLLCKASLPVGVLARVVELPQAGVHALGQPVRVCAHALYGDIDLAPTWYWHMSLSIECVEELRFWKR